MISSKKTTYEHRLTNAEVQSAIAEFIHAKTGELVDQPLLKFSSYAEDDNDNVFAEFIVTYTK